MTLENLAEVQELWKQAHHELSALDFDEEYLHYLDFANSLDIPDLLLDYVDIKDIDANLKGLIFIQAFYDVAYTASLYPYDCDMSIPVDKNTVEYLRKYNSFYADVFRKIYRSIVP